MAIDSTQTTTSEIVVTERVTVSEFRVCSIYELFETRMVRAEVEFGAPVVSGGVPQRGTRRLVTVWAGSAYDSIKETWTNADLLAEIAVKLINNDAVDIIV